MLADMFTLSGVKVQSFTFTHFFLRDFTSISFFPSHLTDIFQPVATAVLRQSEADVAALLPAAADLPEPRGHAGHEEGRAAQQYRHGEDEDQREGGGQEEAVLVGVEGAVPAEEERVEGGHGESAVTQRGLQVKEGRHRLKFGVLRFKCTTHSQQIKGCETTL